MILPSVVRSGWTPSRPWAPSRPDPERDDLVEHEQRADPRGDPAQAREERRVRGTHAARPLYRFDEDRGDVPLDGAEDAFDAVRVVPRQLDHQARDLVRDAGGPGLHGVVRAVVRMVEPRHDRAPGERACRTDGEHRRLGARVREPEPFQRRQTADDLLGQLHLDLGRGRERRCAVDLALDRVHDDRMRVPQDQRRVVAQEVAVLVAIDVPGVDALAADHVRRVGRAVHGRPGRPAGDRPCGALEQGCGPGRPGEVVVDDAHRRSVALSSSAATANFSHLPNNPCVTGGPRPRLAGGSPARDGSGRPR